MTLNAPASPAKRVDVIASLSMESLLRSLDLPVNFRFASEQVSMETSQQMQEVERLEQLASHRENLKKLLQADKPTGTPHLFVLDAEQLAVGALDAQVTLQAIANQRFTDPSRAAVAFLPPPGGYSKAGEAAASLVKETLLSDVGAVALESVDALKSWLGVPTVSMEKIGFLRRLFESKDKAANGSITHREVREFLRVNHNKFHPWSESDIKNVERSLKVSIHHDVHRLLTTVGAIEYKGMKVFNPHQTIQETQKFRQSIGTDSKTKNWIILSAQTYSDEPGVTYYVIIDTAHGKGSVFSSAGGFIRQPNTPFSKMLKQALQTT